ncbi:MAG: glycerate kinase, partial [Deltaproteobacteria bacterium]|nr:glycerate kinase [Deltaproteobacteria bacterium]
MTDSQSILPAIYSAALRAVDPFEAVRRQADHIRSRFNAEGCDRLLVLGFGKAAVPMAAAVEATLGDLALEGLVVTKEGFHQPGKLRKIQVREASHPIPDARGVTATEDIVRLAQEADERTFVPILISGGGSALLVAPAEGLALMDKQKTTSLLLRAGADIGELNAVRKHLSRVKGGRLMGYLSPAKSLSLILSDVFGDRLAVIASGPTIPDGSTFADAAAIIEKYGLIERIPPRVLDHLQKGAAGAIPETPKAASGVFALGETIIVANLGMALDAARREAERKGFRTVLLPEPIIGEAREAGRYLARKALALKAARQDVPPLCLVSGGETTVTVRGEGRGGRNMELALAFALEIEGENGITLLSAGTDGNDGPTDSAGALVDGTTAVRGRRAGFDPERALDDNDSWNFFHRAGGLFITGPTGT